MMDHVSRLVQVNGSSFSRRDVYFSTPSLVEDEAGRRLTARNA